MKKTLQPSRPDDGVKLAEVKTDVKPAAVINLDTSSVDSNKSSEVMFEPPEIVDLRTE